MVKNKTGGNRHKKMARKNVKTNFIKPKIRLVKHEDEMYAKVIEFYGSGAKIICNDGRERSLIIRRKFKGRNKRDNTIAINTMLLVGLRSWECRDPKQTPKADLLFLYGREHINELKEHVDPFILPDDVNKEDEENNFDFDINADNSSFQNVKIVNTNKATTNKATTKTDNKKEDVEEVDWDDI